MNAKKLLALVLALVLCVGCLAACDSKKPAETTPAATTKPAETTKPGETQPAETEPAAPLKNADIYPHGHRH